MGWDRLPEKLTGGAGPYEKIAKRCRGPLGLSSIRGEMSKPKTPGLNLKRYCYHKPWGNRKRRAIHNPQ
jgi:hypothetical protein